MPFQNDWLRTTREKADADIERLNRKLEEKARLDSEIRALTEKVKSWQVILESVSDSLPKPAPKLPRPGVINQLPIESDAHEPDEGKGLRATIREVLREQTHGLRPKEVAKAIAARGFKVQGNSDLGVRVGAELWKMKRTGQLRKTRNGGYALASTESAM